jgi:mannosylglycerate hydrolase
MAKEAIAYVVPHTHWDREWRYPVWTNRLLLVDFLDGLLERLERDPGYRCFVLDGQCVAVEDYLRVRPENTERVRAMVASGRLVVGPWYTLPDQFPLHGECLVRNLLRGVRVAEGLGGCLRIGYTTFGWGQTAQLPQIYAGFGMDFIVAGKRVSEERAPTSEFLWEAPDGTRVLTTRLGDFARANVYFNAYLPVRFGADYHSEAYRHEWGARGVTLHPARPDRCHEDHVKIAGEEAYHSEWIEPGFRAAWEAAAATSVPDCRLLMDGSDFTDCQPILTRMLEDANAAFPQIRFVHGTLEEYADELKRRVDTDRLPVVRGELRDGSASQCSANALATRNYIKMLNKRAENAVLRWAEPMASAAAMLGDAYPRTLFETAWTYLLQAHPHDSINGVTQDKTADDTVYRLNQALEIGRAVGDRAIANLVRRIDLSAFGREDVLVVAINPRPRAARAVAKFGVDVPRERGVWDFALLDSDGNRFAVQTLQRREVTCPVNDLAARPWPFEVDRHVVWADLGEVPAGGYKVFRLEPTATFDRRREWWPPMRRSAGDEIFRPPATLENERLRLVAEPDGTLTLTDKESGRVYRDLNAFQNAGDAGDYWAYYPPYQDQVHTSQGGAVRIWCEENGPLAATLAVEMTMEVPARGTRAIAGVRGESRRSSDTRRLVVTSQVTLRRAAGRAEVRTEVENTVEDHRLRVLFPTDLAASHAAASGHFTVDERPVEPRRLADGTFYPEMQTHPQAHFVDVSDGERGLAILNNCLTEYEVLRDGRTTLALTLFRSVANRICTEWRASGDFPMQKGGQSLRTMVFEYALYPHAGDWAAGGVYEEAEAFNAPPVLYQASAHAEGTLPPAASLFAVEPADLVLSAFKQAEDRESFILRLCNPTRDSLEGRVSVPARVGKAWRTNLNEQREEEIPVEEAGSVRVSVPPGRIVTIEVEPAEAEPRRRSKNLPREA